MGDIVIAVQERIHVTWGLELKSCREKVFKTNTKFWVVEAIITRQPNPGRSLASGVNRLLLSSLKWLRELNEVIL